MKKVVIIGSGITALARAWHLQKSGHFVTVLEKSNRVGGSICSLREGAYLAEEGPNSLQINSFEVDAFLKSIPNFTNRVVYASDATKKRFIFRRGLARPVPMSAKTFITTSLWSITGKLQLLKGLFFKAVEPKSEESIVQYASRRFGDELYNYAFNPVVSGIYAGDPEKLSLPYAFPKIYALEQKQCSLIRALILKKHSTMLADKPKVRKRILSFKNGLEELPLLLASALGSAVETKVAIKAIFRDGNKWVIAWNDSKENYDQLIVTSPAHSLEELPLEPSLLHAISFLKAIEYPPVTVLNVAFKRFEVSHPLDGFGILIPECENRSILGVLFPSSLFTERTPKDEVLLTVFIGGNRQPELAKLNEKALLEIVLLELESILGVKGKPSFTHFRYWAKSIPQYNLGHGKILEQINDVEKEFPGIQFVGNYRFGVSLTNCIEQAVLS